MCGGRVRTAWAAWVALAGLVGLGIGLGLGGVLSDDAPAPPAAAQSPTATPADADSQRSLEAQVASLHDALAFEERARLALGDELDALREEIARLVSTRSGPPDPHAAALDATGRGASAIPQPWFDAAALAERGRPPAEIERLRARFESNELDELYLRDQATREGWIATGRYRNELTALRDALRTDVGDEDYDWVLYATGRPNRVLVQDVLGASAAAEAGLRAGDVIVRYDGALVLGPGELRDATTAGRAGQTVGIDVERGDESLRFYVPRGPLGTRLGRTRRPPE